ncbi:MAG: hypothetical protein R3F39_17270 [Myxococcota bacterium]
MAESLNWSPFRVRTETADELIIVWPRGASRLVTLASLYLLLLVSLAGPVALGWLAINRPKGVGSVIFAVVASVALLGLARVLWWAIATESFARLEVSRAGARVVSRAGGLISRARSYAPGSLKGLRAVQGASPYRGRVVSHWWRLCLDTAEGPVELGHLIADDESDAGPLDTAAALAARLGVPLATEPQSG